MTASERPRQMHGAVNVRRFMGCIENGEKQNARPKGANLELQRERDVG